ncbi:DUF1236 domain-containing protein [Aurantimonas endophytica]|uniref:Uncharacterized protein YraI n=1 Tax=Aurantimonas endophytica TaxID=1522175 RepID=A0A7W6HAQ8_9HYPH|nr:DUF1236 domain-containing protein [Aurantimonas endophytica]MBB4001612.1 uncharacterized protein YraI [Aurantimonas endophytica]MCO6402750.1 DUF1236 domain-containing protein [Aurantimonas endophytica]
MKLKTFLSAGAAALITATAIPAYAQTTVSATTDLNVRAGPGPNYEIVGAMSTDDTVTLEGCTDSGAWCRVTVDGTTGWAYSQYLTADVGGETVVVTERRTEYPVVTYEDSGGTGEVAGAATGAVAGAIVGGPIGAAIGGAAGLVAGAAINPPDERIEYVRSNPVDPVYLEGEAVVGSQLPETVELQTIPDYEYQYVYVNGQPVLVDPSNRQVVYVVR